LSGGKGKGKRGRPRKRWTLSRPPSAEEAARVVLESKDDGEAFRYFLLFVKTIDEDDPGGYKYFPMWPYLLWTADQLCRARMIFIEKSRQMMVSWLLVSYALFRAIRKIGSRIAIQSAKEEAARHLIADRARIILENLPGGVFFDEYYVRRGSPPRVVIVRDGIESEIIGIPQGGEKIRTYTLSGMIGDEATFQPEFDDALAAAMPTLGKRGWFVACGTPNGREAFYRRIYGDEEKVH